VNEEEDNEGAFLCSANFVGEQVDFRSVFLGNDRLNLKIISNNQDKRLPGT
jgi:hypothetical protein